MKHFQDLCFLKSLLEEFIYICSQIKPNKPEDLIGNNPFRTALNKYKSQNPNFPARRLLCFATISYSVRCFLQNRMKKLFFISVFI